MLDLEGQTEQQQIDQENFRKQILEAQQLLVNGGRRSLENLRISYESGKKSFDKTQKQVAKQVKAAKILAKGISQATDLSELQQVVQQSELYHKYTLKQFCRALGRIFVCTFFLNMIYEDFQNWRMFNFAKMEVAGSTYFPRFPYFGMIVLLPCILAISIGNIGGFWPSLIVVGDIIRDSANLIVTQLYILFLYGQRPNELVIKRLAILGCTLLIFVDALRQRQRSRLLHTAAGPLKHWNDEQQLASSKWWSSMQLLGRLLICVLFVYVGFFQIQKMWNNNYGGHHNRWLVVEFLLAIPFALGYQVVLVSCLLCSVLLVEAFICWQFWMFPSNQWTAASHVRLHFVTNIAVSGGLVLLLSMGPGLYSIDQLLKKRK